MTGCIIEDGRKRDARRDDTPVAAAAFVTALPLRQRLGLSTGTVGQTSAQRTPQETVFPHEGREEGGNLVPGALSL